MLIRDFTCPVCSGRLQVHPLFSKSGAKYCPRDGDFYIYRERNKLPIVIFKPYDDIFVRPIQKKIDDLPFPAPPDMPPIKTGSGRPGLVIRCEQTGEVYYGLRQAGAALGISVGSLSLHVNGKKKHAKGYSFRKVDPYRLSDSICAIKPCMSYTGGIPRTRLRCHETGKEFDSIRSTARLMRISYNRLLEHVHNPEKYPSANGYTFSKLD